MTNVQPSINRRSQLVPNSLISFVQHDYRSQLLRTSFAAASLLLMPVIVPLVLTPPSGTESVRVLMGGLNLLLALGTLVGTLSGFVALLLLVRQVRFQTTLNRLLRQQKISDAIEQEATLEKMVRMLLVLKADPDDSALITVIARVVAVAGVQRDGVSEVMFDALESAFKASRLEPGMGSELVAAADLLLERLAILRGTQ